MSGSIHRPPRDEVASPPRGPRPSRDLERHEFCYLTTRGRSTGRPHRVELWFTFVDGALVVMSGGGMRADWVKNLAANPVVQAEVGDARWRGYAQIVDDAADHPARQRLAERYQGWESGQRLSTWATHSLVIEIRSEPDG